MAQHKCERSALHIARFRLSVAEGRIDRLQFKHQKEMQKAYADLAARRTELADLEAQEVSAE